MHKLMNSITHQVLHDRQYGMNVEGIRKYATRKDIKL